MPGVDWRLWRAQVMQESAGNANAVSPVGAMGLAQVMPGTFADISRKAGITGNPFDPATNLQAGAWYMGRLRAQFHTNRTERDRHSLALASYNAGIGHIVRAQRIAGNPPEWQPVADRLPQVTGRHAKETADYVVKIYGYYRRFVAVGV